MNQDFKLERTLTFKFGHGVKHAKLSIGGIERIREGEYICHYTLPYLDGTGKVYGSDALHALMLCIEHVAHLIHYAERDGIGTVWWLSQGDAGGFESLRPGGN